MSDLATKLATSPLTLGTVKAASVSIKPKPGRDRSSGTWDLFLMWDDVPALHQWFQGGPVTTTPEGGGDPVTTYEPIQSLPGWPSMVYSSADVEGIPGAEGIVIDPETGKINYKYATFTANFESQQWGFSGDNQQGLPTLTGGLEIYTAKAGTLKWSSTTPSINNQPVAVDMPRPIPVLHVSIPIYNKPLINFSVVTAAMANPLNSEVMPIFGNAPIKTVRYDLPECSWRMVSPKPVVDFTHHFSLRSVEWDKEMYTDGSFQTIIQNDGSPWIGSSNLNLLLS